MPVIVGKRKSTATVSYSQGHDKALCYGAKSWDRDDGRPVCQFIYRVTGVPQPERDADTNEDGWWCEECCRKRGWLW